MMTFNKGIINILLRIIFSVGIIFTILYYPFRYTEVLAVSTICGWILFIYILSKKLIKYSYILLVIYLLFLWVLLKFLYYQEVDMVIVNFILLIIMHFGFSLYINEFKDSIKILNGVYIGLTLSIILYLLAGNELQNITTISTVNFTSGIYIFFSALIIIINYKWLGKLILYPSYLALAISFYSLTRSSIIASFILVLGLLMVKYNYKFNKAQKTVLSLAIIAGILSLYEILESLIYNIMYRFGERSTFLESPRTDIWHDYLSSFNLAKLLVGSDSNIQFFAGFSNLHNSFLHFHDKFGVIVFLVILIIASALIYTIYLREYVYLVILIACIFRMNFDEIMLVWAYDFIFITNLLFIFNQRKDNNTLFLSIKKKQANVFTMISKKL